MRSAWGPSHYATNEVPPPSGFGTFSMAVVPPEVRERASRTAAEHLDWLGDVMRQSDDATGALLAALMVRHLVPGEDPDRRLGFSPSWLYGQLGHIARKAFQDGETGTIDHETQPEDRPTSQPVAEYERSNGQQRFEETLRMWLSWVGVIKVSDLSAACACVPPGRFAQSRSGRFRGNAVSPSATQRSDAPGTRHESTLGLSEVVDAHR